MPQIEWRSIAETPLEHGALFRAQALRPHDKICLGWSKIGIGLSQARWPQYSRQGRNTRGSRNLGGIFRQSAARRDRDKLIRLQQFRAGDRQQGLDIDPNRLGETERGCLSTSINRTDADPPGALCTRHVDRCHFSCHKAVVIAMGLSHLAQPSATVDFTICATAHGRRAVSRATHNPLRLTEFPFGRI